MNLIGLTTAVTYSDGVAPKFQILKPCMTFLSPYFSGRKFKVVEQLEDGTLVFDKKPVRDANPNSFSNICLSTLKVIGWLTLILPALAYLGAKIFLAHNTFQPAAAAPQPPLNRASPHPAPLPLSAASALGLSSPRGIADPVVVDPAPQAPTPVYPASPTVLLAILPPVEVGNPAPASPLPPSPVVLPITPPIVEVRDPVTVAPPSNVPLAASSPLAPSSVPVVLPSISLPPITPPISLSAASIDHAAPSSTPRPIRDYATPVSADQMINIHYIINTLGESYVWTLLGKQRALEDSGEKIKAVHPLKFMCTILSDPRLLKNMKILRERGLVWGQFGAKLCTGLALEAGRNNLSLQIVEDLATKSKIDMKVLLPSFTKGDWASFIDKCIYGK